MLRLTTLTFSTIFAGVAVRGTTHTPRARVHLSTTATALTPSRAAMACVCSSSNSVLGVETRRFEEPAGHRRVGQLASHTCWCGVQHLGGNTSCKGSSSDGVESREGTAGGPTHRDRAALLDRDRVARAIAGEHLVCNIEHGAGEVALAQPQSHMALARGGPCALTRSRRCRGVTRNGVCVLGGILRQLTF